MRVNSERNATALTIDLPLPGGTQGWLVPGACRGRHREVSDSAVTPGARPHPVARASSGQSVAHGAVSGSHGTMEVLKRQSERQAPRFLFETLATSFECDPPVP